MPDVPAIAVPTAVILAAGNGDRFHNGIPQSKLLTAVAGTPLLVRTLRSARQAGISTAHVVLGYDADRVRALASAQAPDGLTLHFHLNRDWHRENGVSVLTTQRVLQRQPFALLMGDHIFEAEALRRLLEAPRSAGETLLGVDRRPTDGATAFEATKVRLDAGRVTHIGKTLDPFDALDTGLFVCCPTLFEALVESCGDGDTTLSGGIGRLAARGLVRGVDIGQSRWCDIDTIADLEAAEQLVGRVFAS
jgi:choline kinase